MRKATILLAEDDSDIRNVLRELLEEEGYDVLPAISGKQALDLLTRDPQNPRSLPDIVILDLMMPIVTGWQVLAAMQVDPTLAKIPVVVLTAASQGRPDGAAAFLRKPFRVEALLETIAGFLTGIS